MYGIQHNKTKCEKFRQGKCMRIQFWYPPVSAVYANQLRIYEARRKLLKAKLREEMKMRRIIRDYGSPKLSKDFFDKNPFKEFSAARMLYSLLSYPGMDRLASEAARRFITRGKEEAKRISKERNPENLIKIMEQKPDPLNHPLLKKKILGFREIAVPRVIEKLRDNQDDTFAELAIQIIYESKIDCSSQLLGILDSIKDPYTLSLVCLLLGLIGPKEAIQPVWNYYHYLKEEYFQKNYEQGPLLALYEFKERFGFN
ncbi:MAG: hypothetical protein KAU14_03135 [Thermoplasmata archaeon]|nr:hypothetical protein [Thermoplasmata archaeon]